MVSGGGARSISTESRCLPCEGIGSALSEIEVKAKLPLVPDWAVTDDGKRLRRSLRVKDFVSGLQYFNRIAAIAEEEGHHPDLHLTRYSHVDIELWTHALNGITDNDFIVALKIDTIPIPK